MQLLIRNISNQVGKETIALICFLAFLFIIFSSLTPRFLTGANQSSMAFQLPVLGILTLAMLAPILSGGLNLAIIFTANLSGLALAWTLLQAGGLEAGALAFAIGIVAALAVGSAAGLVMGLAVAYTGAHPILVSLAMMIFLRGLGEFLTRGGDISGFPDFVGTIGHGSLFLIPIPMIIFAMVALAWHIMLVSTKHGFSVYMIGSNLNASEYSGIPTKRTLTLIYTFSGLLCGIAGILMVSRFNSVRVGHGEALLLVTVLACFLGGIDPFGGFGKVMPVFIALIILQVLSSGLNLLGANQHLSTAVWGLFLIMVMVIRHVVTQLRNYLRRRE